ncbi:MAG: SRPBCC family protein [Proteobacteria bacterium]|nr:SRPBCC family protein [Pseudomonadota bacterium]
MATIRREFRSPRSADEVWGVLKKFDQVHELAKGFVTATRIEPGGARVVTFANGMEVREHLVSSDDAQRRLAYAITDSPRYTHYNATAQVLDDGEGSRFVWIVDFLPDDMTPTQNAAMDAGAAAMAKALA